MCKRLIYLISLIFMLGFVLPAHAIYVDAKGGAGGNTVNAGTGSTTDWWSTTVGADGLWDYRTGYANNPNFTLGAPDNDIFQASGSYTPAEDCPAIMTTISGLNPGWTYDVSVVYWSATGQNWTIRAGFSLDSMLYFDRSGQGGATAGTATGKTESDRVELMGFLGRIQSDINGQIRIYINDKPGTSYADRTWYDGLIVTPVELAAYNPSPSDGAQRVDPNADLIWDPGAKAHLHDVYFGTDISKVTDANRTNPLGVLVKQDHDANTYGPGTLSLGTTYYWRIDEVNEPDIWEGVVWSFKVRLAQAGDDEFLNGLAVHAKEFAGDQLTATVNSIGNTQYPGYTNYSYSSWSLTNYSGWTSGFFPGCLWYMYELTGNSNFLDWAQTWTAGLQNEQYDTAKHDTGHIIVASYGNGYRLTGDPCYKDVILQTAASYASRFNPAVGCIRSWNGSPFTVIIDNMVTLELLFWAAKNGGPSSYYDMAVSHAYKTLANHVRADGSTHHIVYYDSVTGQVIGYSGGQGKGVDSCWSRGLAWGLTGFTIVYRETSDPNMLAAAKKLADYFVGHLPDDGIPYSDFNDPSGAKDSSAAALAASGLLELSTLAGDPDYRLKYYNCAKNILFSLCTKISDGGYLAEDTNGAPLSPAVLMRACRAYGEPELSAIFGDYYLLEALLRYEAYNIYDLDSDGSISFGDIEIIGENWLKTGEDTPGDFYKDENNIVNFLDFAKFAQVW